MQENNKIEIKRFDKERRQDFIEMLKGFVVTQVRVLRVQQRKAL
jgi:sorting nexin-1/2